MNNVTTTYNEFTNTINRLQEQHKTLYDLSQEYTGIIAESYESLAANTLSTLSEINRIFKIYKNEYKLD